MQHLSDRGRLLPSYHARHKRRCGKETDISTVIYVDHLPSDATVLEIRNFFCPYGTVESVHLIKDQVTGQLHGFGFVDMMRGANEAIAALNDYEFGGSRLIVRYPVKWQEQPPRDPTHYWWHR